MIYVASSWKNTHQPTVVLELRDRLHDVYDFRAPDGADGFAWIKSRMIHRSPRLSRKP